MGRHFGDLAFIRGIIYYKLSPHEQKPFAGCITYGIPNFVPRTLATIHTWLPFSILGYCLFVAVDGAYKRSKRKNPRDYAFETDPEQTPPRCPPKEK